MKQAGETVDQVLAKLSRADVLLDKNPLILEICSLLRITVMLVMIFRHFLFEFSGIDL